MYLNWAGLFTLNTFKRIRFTANEKTEGADAGTGLAKRVGGPSLRKREGRDSEGRARCARPCFCVPVPVAVPDRILLRGFVGFFGDGGEQGAFEAVLLEGEPAAQA